jgi:hypothetical protein
MAQPETPCRLCGVVFNVGRIRRKDERTLSGWTAPGRKWHADPTRPFDPFGSEDEEDRICKPEDGCYWARRPLYWRDHYWYSMNSSDTLDDQGKLYVEEEDSDYVDNQSLEYEEYEYESDDELVGQSNADEEEDDDTGEVESSDGWRRYLIDRETEPGNYKNDPGSEQFSFLCELNKLPKTLPLHSPHIGDSRLRGDEPLVSFRKSCQLIFTQSITST